MPSEITTDPLILQRAQTLYGTNVDHQAQQTHARLKQFAIHKDGLTGETATINTTEALELKEVTGQRIRKTAGSEPKGEVRHMHRRVFDGTMLTDHADDSLIVSGAQAGSEIMNAQMSAYARECDQTFLESIVGTNRVGALGGSNEDLHSDYVIPKDFVRTGTAANSNLTPDKLRYAKMLFEASEFYGQDQKNIGATLCCAINSAMRDNLITYAQLNNMDYSALNKLDSGEVTHWFGIKFLRTELLPRDEVDPNVVNAVMWVSNQVYFGTWAQSLTKVDKRPDLSYATQYVFERSVGGCRKQQKSAATIACQTDLVRSFT